MAEQKVIMRSAEAAKFLGITEGALRQLRYKHAIPYFKNATCRYVYYLKSDLEDWMLATRIATNAEMEAQAAKELMA